MPVIRVTDPDNSKLAYEVLFRGVTATAIDRDPSAAGRRGRPVTVWTKLEKPYPSARVEQIIGWARIKMADPEYATRRGLNGT